MRTSRLGLSHAQLRERNRGLLLDAAESVFAERGYRVATVDDVAKAAGLTKGAVYSHFGSKEALFRAAVRRRFEQRLDAFAKIVDEDTPLANRASLAALDFASSIDDGADWALLFLEAWAEMLRSPAFGNDLRAVNDEFRKALSGVIDGLLAQQGIELDISSEAIAEMMIVVSHGFGIEHRLHPEHADNRLFSQLSNTILVGLLAQDTSRD